ncbi:hypothetical protein D6783_01400, partial [Candidatus Woesearchaeota archaeon]
MCRNGQCVSKVTCGDGTCTPSSENCSTCPQDCACPKGFACIQKSCKQQTTQWKKEVKVFLLIFDPLMKTKGNRRLSQVKGWNDADQLSKQIAADLTEVSGGSVTFKITRREQVNAFPKKKDGFVYTESSYLSGKWHQPDAVDYHWVIKTYNIASEIDAGR